MKNIIAIIFILFGIFTIFDNFGQAVRDIAIGYLLLVNNGNFYMEFSNGE